MRVGVCVGVGVLDDDCVAFIEMVSLVSGKEEGVVALIDNNCMTK